MIPTELFHYTSASFAIEKILYNQQIKIGLMKFLNDPRESKDWTVIPPRLMGIPLSSFPMEDHLIDQEFTKIKQEEWKVVCFATHAPRYKRHPLFRTEEGFLHGACRPRMWASYADNHKGLCLKFNGTKFDELIRINPDRLSKKRTVFRGKVKYSDYANTLDPFLIDYTELTSIDISQVLRNHLITNHKHFFMSKPRDWKTESEFRWLVHSESREPEYLPIKGIIEEVIVGYDFPRVYYPSLFELCNSLEISVKEMIWKNGEPAVSECIYTGNKNH